MNPDPEADRWYRTYPTFPGVATCITLMQAGKARGTWLEIIHHLWVEHASVIFDDLCTAYLHVEPVIQGYIVEAIAAARIPIAIPFLSAQLHSPVAVVHRWAIRGLAQLNTRESRRALWDAQTIQFDDPATTAAFQQELGQYLNRPSH